MWETADSRGERQGGVEVVKEANKVEKDTHRVPPPGLPTLVFTIRSPVAHH